MVRDSAWQREFLAKPLDERRAIVIGLRASPAPSHSRTGAGASNSRRPSNTAAPTNAAITLLAADHESRRVDASTPGA